MTDSYRTDPPDRVAKRRQPKTDAGDPHLPRVVERRPFPGDVHPLAKPALRGILPHVAGKYWHGLTRIELRARKDAVGQPFGYYARDEKMVVLYSLPTVWALPHLAEWLRFSLPVFHAEVVATSAGFNVTWENEGVMGLWFLHSVFAHELGHHFDNQYRTRRKVIRGRTYQEIVADLHATRIEREFWKQWRERRAKRSGPDTSGGDA